MWKGRYAGEPTADAGSGTRPQRGSRSHSPPPFETGAGGPIVSYEWDLNFDGTFEPGPTGATVTYTGGDGPATAFVAVRVTDAAGVSHIDTAPVTLTDRPPTFAVSGAATTTEVRIRAAPVHHIQPRLRHHRELVGQLGRRLGDTAGRPAGGRLAADGDARLRQRPGELRHQRHRHRRGRDLYAWGPEGRVLDQTFGAGGRVDNPFRSDRAVALQGDGRIVTAGGTRDFLLSRTWPTGRWTVRSATAGTSLSPSPAETTARRR